MGAMIVLRHSVRDYGAWRPAYDGHEAARTAAGLTNGRRREALSAAAYAPAGHPPREPVPERRTAERAPARGVRATTRVRPV